MTKWYSDILIVLVQGILRLIIHSFPTEKIHALFFPPFLIMITYILGILAPDNDYTKFLIAQNNYKEIQCMDFGYAFYRTWLKFYFGAGVHARVRNFLYLKILFTQLNYNFLMGTERTTVKKAA